jgi:hypothetical protein
MNLDLGTGIAQPAQGGGPHRRPGRPQGAGLKVEVIYQTECSQYDLSLQELYAIIRGVGTTLSEAHAEAGHQFIEL